MKTIWNKSIKEFDKLSADIKCDIAIVGGGLSGMWCAYKLVAAGKSVAVLEADRVGSGVTSGSSAILSHAQDIIFSPILKMFGKEYAKKYYEDTLNAEKKIKEIIKSKKVDCSFEEIDFHLYTTKCKGKKELNKEIEVYKDLEIEYQEVSDSPFPFKIKKAIKVKAAQFDPLMLLSFLTNEVVKGGGKIFEQTKIVSQPEDNKLKFEDFTITAKSFVFATHFPILNFPGFYFLKMYQDQSYSIVYKPSSDKKDFTKNNTYESIDEQGMEYRRVGNNVLFCGANFRTGTKPYKSKYQIIEQHKSKYYPNFSEVARFMAQDCITNDYLPYAGKYSKFLENVYVITGFNKWGMSNSFVASEVVANMILGKTVKGEINIYSPTRKNVFVSVVETTKNLGVDIAGWANNLLNVDSKKFERVKSGTGAIVKIKGKRVGVYRDEKNKLHKISGICPHLGCSLKWNKDEKSWDCPCHGSRFDVDGKILNNPSIKDAERL